MANTIKLEIELDGKNAIKNLTVLDKKLKKTGDTGKKSFNGMSNAMSSFVGNLGAIAVTKAFSSITRGFTTASRDALDFSKALAEINSIAPRTNAQTQNLAQNLIRLSSEYGKDAQGEARAFYNILSAGVTNTAKAFNVLTQANKASVAGLTDVDTATRGILSVINSYADGSVDASRASDILFATIKEGRTTFPELADTIGRVASIASSAGVKFEDLGGALAFVTKSGIRTDEAVIGLRALMNSVIGPTEQVAKRAKELGIEFSASAIKGDKFAGFFKNLQVATGGSVEELRKLFPNVRAFNVAVKIAGGDLNDFNRILGETAKSSEGFGATQKALETVTNSAGFQFEKLEKQLKNLPLAFLTNFEEPIADALKSVNKFVSGEGILLVVDAVNIVIDSVQDLVELKNDTVDFFDSISKGASDLLDSVSGQGDVVGELNTKLGLQNERLDDLRAKYLELVDAGDTNTGSIRKQIKTMERATQVTKDQLSVFQQVDLEEAKIENDKNKRRNKRNMAIDDFQKKLSDGRKQQLADQAKFAEEEKNNDDANAQAKLEGLLGNQQAEFDAIAELKLAQLDAEAVAKEEALLLKQVEADENFIFLQENLGKENAIRELNRISEIQNETSRIQALKALRNKAQLEKEKKDAKARATELKLDRQTSQAKVNILSSTQTLIQTLNTGHNKALFLLGKSLAGAQIIISGLQAEASALAPPPLGAGPLAGAGLASLIRVNTGIQLATLGATTVQGFQNGGIVGGNSNFGDQNLARVNSGEMILNRRQQENLFKSIDTASAPSGGGGVTINVESFIGEESFVDDMIDKINDAVEFNNKQLRA